MVLQSTVRNQKRTDKATAAVRHTVTFRCQQSAPKIHFRGSEGESQYVSEQHKFITADCVNALRICDR